MKLLLIIAIVVPMCTCSFGQQLINPSLDSTTPHLLLQSDSKLFFIRSKIQRKELGKTIYWSVESRIFN